MRKFYWLLPCILAACACAQEQDDVGTAETAAESTQAAETEQQPPAAARSVDVPASSPQKPERDVSINPFKFARNFFSDQRKIYTFPAKLATGHHVVPVLAVAGATTAIVTTVDPWEGKYFRRHESTFEPFNNFMSENVTTLGTLLIPAGMTLSGYLVKDKYLAHTGLLALEAWVDIDILDIAFRSALRRRRPLDIPLNGDYRDTWFKTGANPMKSAGSFPSGHTGWAFAVATVISRRYPQHKWVRIAAYGLALADMASRVTSSNHFFGDAVFGGVLGYATGRFVVLRQ